MERQIVTLTTDWGDFNCFVGMAKGTLYSLLPNVTVVDITHNVPLNDISQGAFIAKQACPTFPDGTIHIIDIDDNDPHNLLAVKHNNQYYICHDNGLPHLLFNDEFIEAVILPAASQQASEDVISDNDNIIPQTFRALNDMIPAVKKIVESNHLSECGAPASEINARGQRNFVIPDENKLIGYITHIDSHGNAYSNIRYTEFLKIKKGRHFKLSVHEWDTDTLYFTFKTKNKKVNNMLLVSSTGNLMLTHKSGSFAQLMNVTIDSKIEFTFSD